MTIAIILGVPVADFAIYSAYVWLSSPVTWGIRLCWPAQ
jgi:hypothetical protein